MDGGGMSEPIGQYVVRYHDGEAVTVAHLVESIVAKDAVTRCGRRMRDERPSGMELRYSAVPAIRICRTCDRPSSTDPVPVDEYASDAVPEEG
jgi:hypothetical protein